MELQEPEHGTVPAEEAPTAEPPDEPKTTIYYSVFVPNDNDTSLEFEADDYIFEDKDEAMKLVKNKKKARFRQFQNYQEAHRFASFGVVEAPHKTKASLAEDDFVNTPPMIADKVSLFKGPKPQDLVKLRKCIETGNGDLFRKLVWENPRFLVSSGDTPSILHEGFRYNALHVSTRWQSPQMTDLILSTISDYNFIRFLYGDDDRFNNENRIQVLLDLYLNTPDRGVNETPLHFACKFAAADVVEVLVSYSQCDKTVKNKYGLTPYDIIMDRFDTTRKVDKAALKKRLQMLLTNEYYVPVLRAEDNSIMPIVGEPFLIGNSPTAPSKLDFSFLIFYLVAIAVELLVYCWFGNELTHYKVTNNPMSPRLEIHAYAGPMNREGAEQFRKVWKTPPRTTSTPVKCASSQKPNTIVSPTFDASMYALRYTDPVKGLERVGQRLATQFDVKWKEYWPFLDSFIDITSKEGIALFEAYMAKRVVVIDDDSRSLRMNESTISDLCMGVQALEIEDISEDYALENSDSWRKDGVFSSFLCVDKACSVFAHRITFDIVNKINNNFNFVSSHLEVQIRSLQLLTMSYIEDVRFKQINFKCLHPRLGQLMASNFCTFVPEGEGRTHLLWKFEEFLSQCIKSFDCFSSDDEEAVDEIKSSTTRRQLICVLKQMWNHFETENVDCPSEDLLDEEEARNVWKTTKECRCVMQRRKTRRGFGLLRTNHKRNSNFIKNSSGGGGGGGAFSNYQSKLASISKKLFNFNGSDKRIESESNGDREESDDEKFYTPPTSPTGFLSEDDDDEENVFNETQLLPGVYIEGDEPTKTDCAVFKALRLSDCVVDRKIYPSIYRWQHCVGLYSDEERERWSGSNQKSQKEKCFSPLQIGSPIISQHQSTPSKDWMRITGANSPSRTVKTKF